MTCSKIRNIPEINFERNGNLIMVFTASLSDRTNTSAYEELIFNFSDVELVSFVSHKRNEVTKTEESSAMMVNAST